MKLLVSLVAFVLLLMASQTVYAACYSDFDCGFGKQCVKARDDINITGVCVTPSDDFGNPQINTSTPRSQPRDVKGCSFDTDCSIGFSCMKRSGQIYGICVK